MVIGNVAGSSFFFQLLFTLGICALIRPLQVEKVALEYFFPAVILSRRVLLIIVRYCQTSRWAGMGWMPLYVFVGAVLLGMRMEV